MRALERGQRHAAAEGDARIYAASGNGNDLDDLASWAGPQPIDLD